MQLYLTPNLTKDVGAAFTLQAAQTLLALGAQVLLSPEVAPFLPQNPPLPVQVLATEQCYAAADVIITVGGDGTILHETTHSLAFGKPILGVNLGRCGFLATCEADEVGEKFAKLVQGDYLLDPRLLLSATIHSEASAQITAAPQSAFALNDVVISKGCAQQAIDLRIYCDDILVESYRGDGVIIATPTGSTAYSLAAGGPIVDAQTKGIVLTAICPHKLRAPSMVFAPNRVLRVVVGEASRGEVFLSCDGQAQITLAKGERVEITLSDRQIQLVSFSSAAQFEAIDRKIKSKD